MGKIVKKIRDMESVIQRRQWIYPWDDPGQSSIDVPSNNDPSDVQAKIPYRSVSQMGSVTHKMKSRGGERTNAPGFDDNPVHLPK